MGGRHIDGTVMVDQYTQTRQRELRVKTVKSGRGRHYKKEDLAVNRGGGTMELREGNRKLKRNSKENKVRRKKKKQ